MPMQRSTAAVLGAALATAALLVDGVSVADPARADDTTFINDVHNAGIVNAAGPMALVRGGWMICEQLANGATPDAVAAEIVYDSDRYEGTSGLGPDEADNLVNFAIADLCPAA